MLEFFFIGFLGVWLPGPDMLLIFRTSINFGFKKAFWTLLGILTGNLIYLLPVVLGVYFYVKDFINYILFLGSFYILYMGVSSLRLKKDENLLKKEIDTKHSRSNDYVKGLFSNLSNPKAMLYFASVLLPSSRKEAFLIDIGFFLIGVILAFFSIIIVGIFLSNSIQDKYIHIINFVVSFIFIGYGLYMSMNAIKVLLLT